MSTGKSLVDGVVMYGVVQEGEKRSGVVQEFEVV